MPNPTRRYRSGQPDLESNRAALAWLSGAAEPAETYLMLTDLATGQTSTILRAARPAEAGPINGVFCRR